jgi:capsular polysaccharide transport system ATP-binding protein
MIELNGVCKTFRSNGMTQVVADGITATFPTGSSVGILGRNGAGKSTLLNMIAGTMKPDRGTITSDGTISWPVGFRGSFHGELTGAQNVRFIARVYGVDSDLLLAFVEDFAELGPRFHMPLRSYSSGMRAKLAFGLSMGIHFDTYLVDESTAVGDAAFRIKSTAYFQDRLKNSSAVVVSHAIKLLRRICNAGAVLDQGKLWYYDSIEEAIAHHEYLMGSTVEDEDEV